MAPLGVNTTVINHFLLQHEGKEWEDIRGNFIGVFAAEEMQLAKKLIKKFKQHQHAPYAIINTQRSTEAGQHWFSFIAPQSLNTIVLFDSFGKDGFREFFQTDDHVKLQEFFDGLPTSKLSIDSSSGGGEKQTKARNIKFDELIFHADRYMNALKSPTKKPRGLSAAVEGFINTLLLFTAYKQKNSKTNSSSSSSIRIITIADQLQELDNSYCGIFQLYFYYHLMLGTEKNTLHVGNQTKISTGTIKKILNGLFRAGVEGMHANTVELRKFVNEFKIPGEYEF